MVHFPVLRIPSPDATTTTRGQTGCPVRTGVEMIAR